MFTLSLSARRQGTGGVEVEPGSPSQTATRASPQEIVPLREAAKALSTRVAESPKLDLALLMIYPTARPDLVPLFMAEWVVVGDHVQVAVLDVQPLGDQPALRSELAAMYAAMGTRYQAQLPAKEDPPDWFKQRAQPWLLFSKCNVAQVETLAAAFREYLAAAVDGWYLPQQANAAGPQCSLVDEYKQHLFHHSEGRKILRVTFGEEFTEAFLGWHFGPPNAPL